MPPKTDEDGAAIKLINIWTEKSNKADNLTDSPTVFRNKTLGIHEPEGTKNRIDHKTRVIIKRVASERGVIYYKGTSKEDWDSFTVQCVNQSPSLVHLKDILADSKSSEARRRFHLKETTCLKAFLCETLRKHRDEVRNNVQYRLALESKL